MVAGVPIGGFWRAMIEMALLPDVAASLLVQPSAKTCHPVRKNQQRAVTRHLIPRPINLNGNIRFIDHSAVSSLIMQTGRNNFMHFQILSRSTWHF